ncbi:Fructosamine kinase domain containing protein [Rhypophila decipiens]
MPLDIPQRRDGKLGDIDGDFPLDEAIIELFPPDATILAAESYGDSAWTQTGQVVVQFADDTVKKFFLKLALGDHGRQLLRGEFTAISTIKSLIPSLVPQPLSWGKYSFSPPGTFFFIEDFHDMDMRLPNPAKLARRVLELHSQTSPNGMFGFPVTTFDGIAPHVTEWEPSWTVFFTRLLKKSVECDAETNGEWPAMRLAADRLLNTVIPRLLDPLDIVPRLIHGDLWSGNIGTDEETGNLIFFDAGSFYAHNELELGMWRRYGVQNLGQPYLDEYRRLYPPDEPQEEFGDRHRLYSLKFDLNHSAGHAGDKARDVALNNMIYLCERHASAEGLPEYDPRKDPSSGQGYIYGK